MAYKSNRKEVTESKSLKNMRIALAVLYFIQTILTTFPFMIGLDEKGNFQQLTAFEIAFQTNGYTNSQEIRLALLFGVFVVFPIICFFFCVLDKSIVKNIVSIICCLVCCSLMLYVVGGAMGFGCMFSLLLYVVILFMTMQSLIVSLATSSSTNK